MILNFYKNYLFYKHIKKMKTRTIYDKPQCEVLEFMEQSVLCSSATGLGGSISDPWSGLGEEEKW